MRLLSLAGHVIAVAALPAAWAEQRPLKQQPHGNSAYSIELPSTPLLNLHRNLVEINSVTGKEKTVGNYLVSYLRSLNLTVDTQEVAKDRFNIHAYAPGHRKTRALFSSHIDTVPPFYNYTLKHPISSFSHKDKTSETEIWGRGTVDDKACVASQITAFESLRKSGAIKPSDLGLLFVVGEETGGDGMVKANELGLSWDAVIFGEPTESKLASGHKGLMQFEVRVKGKAAHSGYPWLGRSANEVLIAALAGIERLKDLSEDEGGLPRSEKYGNTTLNIGKIEGGVAGNVVAESAVAIVSGRLAGGTVAETKAIVIETIEQATKPLLADGKGKNVAKPMPVWVKSNCEYVGSLEVVFTAEGYPPVDIDTDIDGFETITVNYGTDVPNLKGKHKRYLYGPGSILVAHSDHEHLTVGELEQSVEDYKKIALAVLKM